MFRCNTYCVSFVSVAAGALCSLSSLTRLRELRLGDVDGNNPEDVETICNLVSQLTSLHMGYCPRLQVMHRPRLRVQCHYLVGGLQLASIHSVVFMQSARLGVSSNISSMSLSLHAGRHMCMPAIIQPMFAGHMTHT